MLLETAMPVRRYKLPTFTSRVLLQLLLLSGLVFLGACSSGGAKPGAVAVPSVIGESQSSASTALVNAGLLLGSVTMQSSATVASGQVISESPDAGTSVAVGSTVNLIVSSGPADVS